MPTTAERNPPTRIDRLPLFPEGWFFVATRRSIEKRKLIERKWMGGEIVVWCDETGRVCVADAYCPHLGSHMGPKVGGLVRGGCIVCPFHGFAFDTSGSCVSTPNAPPPKAAKLKVYETREIMGLIFAWWGHEGRPPQWELPAEPRDGSKWSSALPRTLRFKGHPQETTENSVDVEHLEYTHGYDDVRPVEMRIEGPYLKSAFNFSATSRVAGIFDVVSHVSVVAHVHGLGYSFVEVHEKGSGIRSRMWVLATPIDGTFIDLTIVAQVHEIRKPGQFLKGLAFLPVNLRHKLMVRLALREEIRYVKQDVVIWEEKRYRSPPRLCRTDGPIGKYRLYCRQFYPGLRKNAAG